MSSFDPLSGSSTTYKSEPNHPLSAPELPFHEDDDDWVPPTLPGEENLARPFASGAAGRGRSGSRNSARRGSPLDEPLDPLLHSLQDDRSSNGVTERYLENPGAFGSRWMASTSTPAVEHSNGNGAGYAGDSDRPKLGDGTLRSAGDDFSRRQAVGARNMGTGGGTESGTGGKCRIVVLMQDLQSDSICPGLGLTTVRKRCVADQDTCFLVRVQTLPLCSPEISFTADMILTT